MKKGKDYLLKKMGFTISWDGFIITNTLLSKWICDLLCNFKNKIIVKLSDNLYILNK
jgi:hypothetical protein